MIVGLFQALLEAIHGSDEQIGGQGITRLTADLEDSSPAIAVESTVGFGERADGAANARIVVGREIIDCDSRTLTSFGTLTRGVQNTRVKSRYPVGTAVYDLSRNTSAIDLVYRALLVDYAIGPDLDQVGRNLGLHRCSGLTDDVWRGLIKALAYLAKQPPSAIITALDALLGPANYSFYERSLSSPNTIFVTATTPLAASLQGRFMLNSGERHVVAAGQVTVDYPIDAVPVIAQAATGSIRVVSGAFLVDGEQFDLDDGVNPAVTFEFDNDGSVVPSATLRPVNFTAGDSELAIRAAIIAAINAAPTLAITAGILDGQTIALVNDTAGAAGNQTITETVAEATFVVAGMSGGVDATTVGVLGVYLDLSATRDGVREGMTNLFTGGSYLGNVITLGIDPGAVSVVVDYTAFQAHYLAPDETYRNDGTDYPPYFADSLSTTRCVLDQVRAAGVGIQLSAGL